MAGRVVGCSRLHRRCPQWSELPTYLLELILEKLDLVAHGRFASVCSSWRSVAINNPPINKPLYFALSRHPQSEIIRGFITSFIPSWIVAKFYGALDAWLVILVDGKDLFLLNKGFNSIIPLPPPPRSPKKFFRYPHLCKVVLSSPPSSSSSSSSGECTVVIKQFTVGVFYCRLGSDKSFTKLSNSLDRVNDIQFYKEQLYVLCENNTLVIFDHLLNKVTQLVANFGDSQAPSFELYGLLISENKLLIIGRWPRCVFELERNKSKLIRVNNINDNLLLLINSFCSLSITKNEHKEFHRAAIDKCSCTFILNRSEDSDKAKVDDPWPLFFYMFSYYGIMSFI